jgi:hypothetical protein
MTLPSRTAATSMQRSPHPCQHPTVHLPPAAKDAAISLLDAEKTKGPEPCDSGPFYWRGVRDLNPWTRGALNPRRHTPFEESRVNPGTSSPRGSPRQSLRFARVLPGLGDMVEPGGGFTAPCDSRHQSPQHLMNVRNRPIFTRRGLTSHRRTTRFHSMDCIRKDRNPSHIHSMRNTG